MTFRQRVRAPDSYGLLLVLILASLIAAASSGRPIGQAVTVVLQGGTLLYALWTARAGRRVVRVAVVLVPAIVLAAAVLTGGESDTADAVVPVTSAVLTAAAILLIVRRVGAHPRVDAAAILGALCTYLLIGMFFSAVFGSVSEFQNAAFFAQEASAASVDLLYFSFVTMTTVGYGDLTAATNLGRMLAVTEALIGQLYLVTVVALVIGNIGRERRAR
ncbi:MAG: potassium channel family protein [Actinomycetota bacterium]